MGGLDTEVGGDRSVAAATGPQPRLGASHGIIAFALMNFGQVAASMMVMFGAIVGGVARGENFEDRRVISDATIGVLTESVVASVIAAAWIILTAVWIFARHLIRDRSPNGLGLFVPRWRDTLLWLGAGIAIGCGFAGLQKLVQTEWTGGPLSKALASGPGEFRIAISVMAMTYAPLFEELLFRGLMLRGMIASWGMRIAGTVVTLLFFAVHLPETFGYWPAMVAVLGLSVATLVARLRTGSLVPAMAAHFGYNAVALAVLFADLTPRP